MAKRSVLVSWIGHADLTAMAGDLGEQGKKLLAEAKVQEKYGEKPGPLKTAIQVGSFDETHLLSNYPANVNKAFAKWLGSKPEVHEVSLTDPTDYQTIFEAADHVLAKVDGRAGSKDTQLNILLSPGTPAMTVIWVLLGSSRYPARFLQTFKGKLNEAKVPSDLFEGIVPDLIRDRDLAFQTLAAHRPQEVLGFEDIIGESNAIKVTVGRTQRAALRDVSVLLLGESGSGKEMFANAIHKASRRRDKPFCCVNCAAIPKDLLESELFGHEKGAFTGADKAKQGLFSQADGGTLFLDEIGECDLQLQAKILRVLQPPADKGPCHRVFRPVGSQKDQSSDVRIVAATNRQLQQEVNAGRFREDLYYRIAVITLELPALRERRKDVPVLAEHFLAKINKEFGADDKTYKHKRISGSAMEFVKRYGWPGNVRQLFNTLTQAAVMTDSDVIDRSDITAAIGDIRDDKSINVMEQPLGDGFKLDDHLNAVQTHYLRRAMGEAQGNKARASRLLGLSHYQTLDARLKRLKVPWEAPQESD